MNYEERMYWRSVSGRSVGELAQKWSLWHHCTDTSIVATFAANLSSKVTIGTHCALIMEILSSTLCFFVLVADVNRSFITVLDLSDL